MIIALLVVIVLVLLFGAGVVKGWLANGIGMGCGFIAIVAAVLWLGSFFGENGPEYVIYGFCGLILLLALAAAVTEQPK